jgi:hypothetical protein
MIRELALPMILAMGGLLRDRTAAGAEATAWAARASRFSDLYGASASRNGSPKRCSRPTLPRPAGRRCCGIQFALKSIAKVDVRHPSPEADWRRRLLVLSLFGWASVRAGWARAAQSPLARLWRRWRCSPATDTFYWALIARHYASPGTPSPNFASLH